MSPVALYGQPELTRLHNASKAGTQFPTVSPVSMYGQPELTCHTLSCHHMVLLPHHSWYPISDCMGEYQAEAETEYPSLRIKLQ